MAYTATDELIVSIMTLRTASLAERITAVGAAGCQGLGWRLDDFAVAEEAQLAHRLLAETGVKAYEIEFFREWLGQETDTAYQAKEAQLFTLAKQLKARHMNVAIFTSCTLDEVAAGFKALCRRAAPYSLIVQLEFMPYTPPVDSLQSAWEVVRRADEPNGGLLLDTWHWVRSPGSAAALSGIPAECITSVQLGDALAKPMADITEESRHHRCVPGTGGADVVGFLQALEDHGVEAPLSVEVMSDRLDALPPVRAAQIVADGTRGVLEELAAQRKNSGGHS